jgi:hypothetical protein
MLTPSREKIVRKPEYILWWAAFRELAQVADRFLNWPNGKYNFPMMGMGGSDSEDIRDSFFRYGYKKMSAVERKELKAILGELRACATDLQNWIDSMEKKFRFSADSPAQEATVEGNVITVNFGKGSGR